LNPGNARRSPIFKGEHEVVFEDCPLDADLAAEHANAEIVSAFISSKLNKDVLETFDRLKRIATRSTGVDHIDVDTCRQRGIEIANVPTYGKNTVAEHAFALLLAISHKLIDAVDRTRRGDFSQEGLRGFDLQGRTMGIVGTGDIGEHTARIARGFRMAVLAFDVRPREDLAREIGFTYVDMNELFARSDVISLHVRGTEKTRNLISADAFAAMM
jgi:D-lactate dehydrogenase